MATMRSKNPSDSGNPEETCKEADADQTRHSGSSKKSDIEEMTKWV